MPVNESAMHQISVKNVLLTLEYIIINYSLAWIS